MKQDPCQLFLCVRCVTPCLRSDQRRILVRVSRLAFLAAATVTLSTTSGVATAASTPSAVSDSPTRSIGPALMGGRIADVAVHQQVERTVLAA